MSSGRIPRKPLVVVEDDGAALPEPLEEALDASTSYVYESLPSRDYFRLIELSPADKYAPLEGKITLHNLEFSRFPSYTAVSYTWNDSRFDNLTIAGKRLPWHSELRKEYDFRHAFWCDGRRLLISTNLRDALRRFRHPTESRLLWVDAICINQEDYAERAEQVLMMPKIYHRALEVLYWLGEEDEDSALALELLCCLALAGQELHFDRKLLKELGDIRFPGVCARLGLPPFPSHHWRAIPKLLERPVFRRLWIVQELATATKARTICGSEMNVSLMDLINGIIFLDLTSWSSLIDAHFNCGGSLLIGALCLTAIFDAQVKWLFQAEDLRRFLVAATQRFETSEPRDKVFAILGLINDTAHRDSHDVHHGGDSVLDGFRAMGFDPHRTADGGLHIAGNCSSRSSMNENREKDLVYDEAVRMFQETRDAEVLELKTEFGKLLCAMVDLLTDIMDQWCGTRKPKLTGRNDNDPKANVGSIRSQVRKVQNMLTNREQEHEGDMIQQFVLWNLVRLRQPIDLVQGVEAAHYADFEDRAEADTYTKEQTQVLIEMGWPPDIPPQKLLEIQDDECWWGNNTSDEYSYQEEGAKPIDGDSDGGDDEEDDEEEEEEEEEEGIPPELDHGGNEQEGPSSQMQSFEKDEGRASQSESRAVAEEQCKDFIETDFATPHSSISERDFLDSSPWRLKEMESSILPAGGRMRSESEKSPWNAWSSKALNLTMPDYLMPVEDVYREFTLHCLEADQTLDIFSLIEPRSIATPGNLPSWVPDFSLVPDINARIPLVPYHKPSSCPYKASGPIPTTFQPFKWSPNDADTLHGTAKIIDLVSWVDLDDSRYEPKGGTTPYPSGGCLADALWRTLIGNRAPGPNGPIYPAPESFSTHFEALITPSPSRAEKPSSETGPLTNPASKSENPYLAASTRFLRQQRIFFTETGWIGVGPRTTRPHDSDWVCVLRGARVPVVLRAVFPDDEIEVDHFEMVGECYVHGLMDGEVVVDPSPAWLATSSCSNWEEIKIR